MNKIVAIIGARPQFIKHFPFEKEAIKDFDLVTIHTGQHYDKNMSDVFFDQLGMRKPDYLLSLGGGSHGVQTGNMLIEIEKILMDESPDGVIVYGDTNSTLAGSLAASKLHIPVFHIEAGLRSFNKQMPEEINRIMTDHVSNLLLVPSEKSVENLSKEGIYSGVHIVGDIMKDMVFYSKKMDVLSKVEMKDDYTYVTLHRPYNVDEPKRLKYVLEALGSLEGKLIFSAHPRTRNSLIKFNLVLPDNIKIIDPQPYFENLSYLYYSRGLITDSGGMQKEAYWLEKPCTTIRSETEWVETLEGGANRLMFEELSELNEIVGRDCKFKKDLYGGGHSAKDICHQITEYFSAQ